MLVRTALRVWLSLLCAVGGVSALGCEKTVRIHPDPLVLVRLPSGELSGPQLETVKEALRRMGCEARPVALPWARALSQLQAGELDILPGAHMRPEREAYAWFSRVPWPSRNRIFMRSRDPRLAAMRELRDLEQAAMRLGLQAGVSYGTAVDSLAARAQLPVQRVPKRQSLWHMLARGRVDAVPADEIASLLELQRLGLEGDIQASDINLHEEPSRTAFSRRTIDASFVARFDDTLQAMQRDGSVAQIEQQMRDLVFRRPGTPAR